MKNLAVFEQVLLLFRLTSGKSGSIQNQIRENQNCQLKIFQMKKSAVFEQVLLLFRLISGRSGSTQTEIRKNQNFQLDFFLDEKFSRL